MKNKVLEPEVQEVKEELGKTADMILDGLDIVLEESIKTAKKVWKDTEDVRMDATRKGLSLARKLLEKAERKFL